VYFPPSLKLLLQLHRELRCPPHLHESFWIAHRTPSHANLATILSRVIQLAESRVLLFDLLKACMGNPSPKLLTRMLEDNKRKQEDKVANADLFARLNFFGQSSDQIRARARATTSYSFSSENSADSHANGLPKDLDELRILIRGTSQHGGSSSGSASGSAPAAVKTQRNSQILKPSQMIQFPGTLPSVSASPSGGDQKPLLKRYASSKAPSMEMITEDNDEEEDGEEWEPGQEDEEDEAEEGSPSDSNNGVDERTRQESIRKFIQARFSGRDSGASLTATTTRVVTQTPSFASSACNSFCSKDDLPSESPSLPPPATTLSFSTPPRPTAGTTQSPFSPSPAPRHRSSKRISMQCVHPKLLEKICHEWMESVPWQVPSDSHVPSRLFSTLSPSPPPARFLCSCAIKEPLHPLPRQLQGVVLGEVTSTLPPHSAACQPEQ
jgi:hypothetical protein